jgi:hypothetical protein
MLAFHNLTDNKQEKSELREDIPIWEQMITPQPPPENATKLWRKLTKKPPEVREWKKEFEDEDTLISHVSTDSVPF